MINQEKVKAHSSEWTHPSTGEIRHYINRWDKLIDGLEFSTYKTGNISAAKLDGESISNSSAKRIFAGVDKVYVTGDTVIVQGYGNKRSPMSVQEIAERIKKTLTI